MKLREIARRLELAPSYISDIENDRRVPSEEVLRQLATELSVEFDELMSLAGRVGNEAEKYLKRSPAATTLFRRIHERNFSDDDIKDLLKNVDRISKRKERDE